MRFDAILQVGRRRAFLAIARSESMFFHIPFAVICHAFWRYFAGFGTPIWKTDLDVCMVLEVIQNA